MNPEIVIAVDEVSMDEAASQIVSYLRKRFLKG
jgi:hypothetical protein